MAAQTKTRSVTLSLAEVRDLLDAEVFYGEDLSVRFGHAGAADLMSDVLALSKSGWLLLTGLMSVQVIRTAVVADLCGIVFVRGKKPADNVLALARESHISLLGTKLTMFEAAGRVYEALAGG
jgi:hypothetical protein